MNFAGFALLAMTAMATAQPSAEPSAVDETKPVTRAEISARLDTDYADLDKSAETELEGLRKKRDEAFAKLDTDSDGLISKAEFEARTPLPKVRDPDAKPFLDQFDADKDGIITRDEFRAPTLANFDRLDANKDDTLTPDEAKGAPAVPAPAKKPMVKKTPPMSR